MKKDYLFLMAFFFIFQIITYSQILWQDNFENYEEGDFIGENGWIREGGENEWVQIINLDTEYGKSMQLQTPEENYVGIFVTHYNNWTNHEVGNDILEVEFDFYTGAKVSEGLGMIVISTDEFDEILSVIMAPEDNVIAVFAENLDENLVSNPEPNTWYHIVITYNSTNGEIKARVNDNPVVEGYGTAGLTPNVFDFTSIIESNIGIDNVSVSATEESVLGTSAFEEIPIVKIFPNPTVSHINIQSNHPIKQSVVYDINGKKVREFGGENQLNLSGLASGSYLLKLSMTNGASSTHKITIK